KRTATLDIRNRFGSHPISPRKTVRQAQRRARKARQCCRRKLQSPERDKRARFPRFGLPSPDRWAPHRVSPLGKVVYVSGGNWLTFAAHGAWPCSISLYDIS